VDVGFGRTWIVQLPPPGTVPVPEPLSLQAPATPLALRISKSVAVSSEKYNGPVSRVPVFVTVKTTGVALVAPNGVSAKVPEAGVTVSPTKVWDPVDRTVSVADSTVVPPELAAVTVNVTEYPP
jgi:hypothetical protein